MSFTSPLRALIVAIAAMVCVPHAHAAWLAKTVRTVIPWPPSGSTDIIGQLRATELTQRLQHHRRATCDAANARRLYADDAFDRLGIFDRQPKAPVDLVHSFAPLASFYNYMILLSIL